MSLDLKQERQQAHALLDLLPPAKLGAVRSLLEVMVEDDDDDQLTDEDRASVTLSRKYFREGGRAFPSSRWSRTSALQWNRCAAEGGSEIVQTVNRPKNFSLSVT